MYFNRYSICKRGNLNQIGEYLYCNEFVCSQIRDYFEWKITLICSEKSLFIGNYFFKKCMNVSAYNNCRRRDEVSIKKNLTSWVRTMKKDKQKSRDTVPL